MRNLSGIFRSSIGKKYLMALSGLLLFAFVIFHMLGNLQIYLGPEAVNAYAHFLKTNPGLLWTGRIGLLVLALVHIVTAFQISAENRAARPETYSMQQPLASFASRTILFSGLIILAFIVYHLMHFTIGATNPQLLEFRDALGRHDVYRMMVVGFSNLWVSGFYILAMVLLCLHLSHGVGSLFQSLGLKTGAYALFIDRFARLSALLILVGNTSIPLAVLTGVVR